MGSREQNFYNALARGWASSEAARRIQDLYLAGSQREAAAAVPVEFIDPTSLIGPRSGSRTGSRYAEAGVTTLSVHRRRHVANKAIATLRSKSPPLERSYRIRGRVDQPPVT